MVRNHQGNKQPIEPSLVNQTTSKADYTNKVEAIFSYILLIYVFLCSRTCNYLEENWFSKLINQF